MDDRDRAACLIVGDVVWPRRRAQQDLSQSASSASSRGRHHHRSGAMADEFQKRYAQRAV